jgi:hypothetical protein
VHRLMLLATLSLFAFAARPLAADSPALIDCPWTFPGSEPFIGHGFYVPRFPGKSLTTVTLPLQFTSPGTYQLALTARAGSFTGTLVGTSIATVTIGFSSLSASVPFSFAAPAITPQTAVVFQGSFVSGPLGTISLFVQTPAGCPVVEVDTLTAPLGVYHRLGVALRIEGDTDATTFVQTTTVPSIASVHGQNGTFFHTDLWLFNRDPNSVTVTARYHCFLGQDCGSGVASFQMDGFGAKTISDVVSALFGSAESAGALDLFVTSQIPEALYTLSRTYSPALPAATAGASIAALPATAANGNAVFVGLAGNGGDTSSGFRTNVGVYNPQAVPTSVGFRLQASDGTLIGTTTLTLAAFEAHQLNDIFASTGHGEVVTTDAVLLLTSDVPIFSFATVIDNRTGDFVYQGTTKRF